MIPPQLPTEGNCGPPELNKLIQKTYGYYHRVIMPVCEPRSLIARSSLSPIQVRGTVLGYNPQSHQYI